MSRCSVQNAKLSCLSAETYNKVTKLPKNKNYLAGGTSHHTQVVGPISRLGRRGAWSTKWGPFFAVLPRARHCGVIPCCKSLVGLPPPPWEGQREVKAATSTYISLPRNKQEQTLFKDLRRQDIEIKICETKRDF